MRKSQGPSKSNEPQFTAFHPRQQPLYKFEQLEADAGRVKVRFAPLKAAQKLMKGTATIDRSSGLVTGLEGSPSESSVLLSDIWFSMTQSDTACGPRLKRISMKGTAGVLFLKLRFRGVTVLTEHEPR